MSRMHNPAHPGEVLREFLPADMSVTEAAQRLGISRVMLSRVLNGRSSMSADMAIRVGLLTRTTPDTWLSNQMQWDLWQSSRKPKPKVQPLRRAA
jgi:addiction module HigA family antidote